MQIEEAVEVWRTFKDYVHAKDRQPAAEQFVTMLADGGMEDSDLWALAEIDEHIEDVVKDMLGEQEERTEDNEWDER